jgi:23S rRNA pseudouridine2605 synthase
MSKNHKRETNLIRLQKYIADCGITSRRKAEELILQGHVKVNGKRVTELGTKVDPKNDAVDVKGENIDVMAVDHMYLLVNKPRGYVTTVSDPEGRETIMDLVRAISTRIFPVGRLDYLSEGLILMTNDGDMANMIMHPSYEVTKTYEVKVFGKVTEAIVKKLRAGIQAEDGFLKPQSVRVIEVLPHKTWIEFRLNEGKNREIRRLCEACGLTIDKLRRVAIGALSIQGVKPGSWRYVTKQELLTSLGINKDGSPRAEKIDYVSAKKTVNISKMGRFQRDAKLATDQEFTRYRKETYFETIKLQKEIAEKIAEQKAKDAVTKVQLVPSFAKSTPTTRPRFRK